MRLTLVNIIFPSPSYSNIFGSIFSLRHDSNRACVTELSRHGVITHANAPSEVVAHTRNKREHVCDCRQFTRRTGSEWQRRELPAFRARGPTAKVRARGS